MSPGTPDAPGGIGLPPNSEAVITIDVAKAMSKGIKFYRCVIYLTLTTNIFFFANKRDRINDTFDAIRVWELCGVICCIFVHMICRSANNVIVSPGPIPTDCFKSITELRSIYD